MGDAFERARLIAAKLAANGGSAGARPQGASGESTLGKRKSPYDSGGPSLRVERIYLPVRQHPDVKFQGLIIGPGASTIKKLQADSGARIALRGKGSSKEARTNLTPEDMDELHVMVEGTDGQVARAKQDIQNILANLQQIKEAQLSALAGGGAGGGGGSHYGPPAGGSGMGMGTGTGGEYSEDIRVPSVHVGRLIGKGGEMSRRLQQDSGARMSIAKVGNPERIVTLSGTQESVQRLKAAIMSRLDEEDCRGNGGGGMGMGAAHGGGSFYGGAGAAGALRALSGQRGGGGGQELDHPIVLKISLPHDKCGALIGRGGQTIRSLQEKTQCAIKVPSQPDPSNPSMRVVSVGAYSQEQADDAQAQIFAVIQEATQTRNDELAGQTQESYHLPDQFSGMVIGKGGSTIKALQSRCNCRVQIPNQCDPALQPPARLCTLVGTAKAIAAARIELDNIIAQGNMGYTTPQLDAYGAVQAVHAVAPNANPYGASGMYGAAPSPYGASMAAAGGAGYYGASMAPPMAAVGYYGAYGGATSTLPSSDQTYAHAAAPPAAPAAPAAPAVVEEDVEPEDDDAKVEYYHKKYWEYATYYGEKAAREFYGDWSPVAGTAPPAGVVPAADPVEAKGDHEATAGGTQDIGTSVESNEEKKDDVEAKAEAHADADAGAEAEAETGAEDDENDSGEGSAGVGGEGEDAPLSAEEERAHADEVAAYKAQYREWWLFHGKAAGAPEEPPEQ